MTQRQKKIVNDIKDDMIQYYTGDPKRIQHFLKVYIFSEMIGFSERLSDTDQFILELAALLHDIGIKRCEEVYHNTSGKFQEIEGPPIAKEMLMVHKVEDEISNHVLYLISKHHSYEDIKDKLLQILIESDFIVNAYEDNLKEQTIEKFKKRYFKTIRGIELIEQIYG